MSISFSGLVSGLDTSSWVDALLSVKQQKVTTLQSDLLSYQTTKTTLNDTRSKVSSLRTAIEKVTDAKFGGVFDLFGQTSATSSNPDVFTATAAVNAKQQNYDISVQQLATCSKATSKVPASSVADENTLLSNIGITTGTLTTYVDGHKHAVTIGEDDTFGDLIDRLEAFGIMTDISAEGVVTFTSADPEKSIHIGSTTDVSNFASLLGLDRQEDGSYTSTNSIYKASLGSVLTSEDSGFNSQIKAGTFTIGNAEFTIDEGTTLASLISEINSNAEAQAYAYWDDATGKMSITSTREGASYINIEAGTSNFTDVMGFTNSTWDEDGNLLASKMYTDVQELGKNAIFSVNGTQMISTSNTVTSDISRMDGVTLTLNRVSNEDDGRTTLKVTQDVSGLADALKSFVSAYNNVMSNIDDVTARGSDLSGETSLTSLKNTLRNYASGANTANGGVYKLLADIGISTSSANAGDINGDTQSLYFDEEKFRKALEENPDSVKALLADDNGIFSMMENTVEQSLKATVGFFDVKQSTLDSEIKKANEKISKKNTSIETYKAQLEKKFQAMENMIASMQQNYSYFTMGSSS
ncbi:flagellar filament capping protein FliD [bacterium]|nr:flagellar filament capping protein FliD [bacterium]